MQIYKTTNLINGKWYIGKDEGSRPYYLGSGKRLSNAIKKYGKEQFTKEILEECSSREELIEREIWWITHTNAQSDPNSYNIGAGGVGGDWTSGFTEEEVKRIYEKRGYAGDRFSGAREKIKAMTKSERQEFYENQAEYRCKGWYVSKLDNPDEEIYVNNLNKWCKENHIDTGQASSMSNPNSALYGCQSKGWRIRRSGGEKLPPYNPDRGKGFRQLNTSRKGLTWKVVDGKRKWIEKS